MKSKSFFTFFKFKWFLLQLLVLVISCSSTSGHFVPDANRLKGLDSDPQELVHLADQLLTGRLSEAPPPLKTTDRGLAALERALKKGHPKPEEVLWRLSRACFLMTENLEDKLQRYQYGERGMQYARRFIEKAPGRVEGYYFLALNGAKVAESTRNLKMLKTIISWAEKAKSIDETFDDAGPLRFLGKVYITAPAWPVSVGSSEKAVELLKRAVAIAPVSLNQLFLGQAYYREEDLENAEKLLRLSIENGKAHRLDPRWLKEAKQYLEKIRESSPGGFNDPS